MFSVRYEVEFLSRLLIKASHFKALRHSSQCGGTLTVESGLLIIVVLESSVFKLWHVVTLNEV